MLNGRATCYLKQKQYKKAIEDLQAILKITAEVRDVHEELVKVYKITGDTKSAQAEQKFLDSFDAEFQLPK